MKPAQTIGLAMALLWLGGCQDETRVTASTPPTRDIVGQGIGHFDVATGEVTFSSVDASGALLDSGDVLPQAGVYNCEAAGWNPATLVLSVNAFVANLSTAAVYLTPVELRLTGIAEANLVTSVNTNLINAGCGTNGLSLSKDDKDGNGVFDCILPQDNTDVGGVSYTANDPGWDFSSALGADDKLTPGEWSGCRFVHFNLVSQTNFTFSYSILGVVEATAKPPAPTVDPIASPTKLSTVTVTGRCVTTTSAGDVPVANEVTVLGGIDAQGNTGRVDVPCDPSTSVPPCVNIGGIDRCGEYSADVTLRANTSNRLEIYQTLYYPTVTDPLRSGSSYLTVVQDSAAPLVVGTQPANGALGVVPAVDVLVIFSEIIDPTTVNGTSVYLREQGQTTAIPASVSIDSSGTKVIISPTSDLQDETTYEIVVTTSVADLAGNPLANQVVTSFTTAESTSDTIPPAVIGIQPANGAANVDRRTSVAITFSEGIADLAAGDIVVEDVVRQQTVPGTFALSPDRTVVTFTVAASYDTTGADPDTGTGCVDVSPPSGENDFDCSSNYRVTVTTGVEDLSGNPLTNAYVSTFATSIDPDNVPPSVDGFIPSTAATGVSEAVHPTVLFSEPVSPATVNTSTFFLKEDGLTLVPAVVTVAGDGLSASLTPTSTLTLSQRYVIFVLNGVQDLAGNPLAALVNSDFTVRTSPDTTGPTVVSVTPPDGSEGISRTTDVVVRFDEPVDPNTVNTGTMLLDEMRFSNPSQVNEPVEGLVTLSQDGLVATFSPFAELRRWRVHRLTVTTGVTDLAGNPMLGDFVSTFTVETDDDVAPCVVGVSPADGSVDVPENTHLGVLFSEPMDPATVVASAFVLTGPAGPIGKAVSLSGDQTQVVITPAGDLPAGTIVLTVTDALQDDSVQGNALDQGSTASGCLDPTGGAELGISFDVVGLSDVTGPKVVAISPTNGEIGVSRGTDVVITFDEPIDPLTATSSNLRLTAPTGGPVGTDRTFSTDLRVATLDPTILLDDLTYYTITIPTSVRDLAGNSLQSTVVSYFETSDSSLDTKPPSVFSTCPVDSTTGVDRLLVLTCNQSNPGKIVIVFDEPLDGGTVHLGTFHLVEFVNVVVGKLENDITESVELLPGGTTVIITPQFSTANGLKNATYHQIRISPTVTDTAGNGLAIDDQCGLGTGDDCHDFDT